MEDRYYSRVLCHLECTGEQLDAWLQQCTDLGDTVGEPVVFDVEFSADFGKSEIGFHASHELLDPHDAHPDAHQLDHLQAARDAVDHAATMLYKVGALQHLRVAQTVITQGAGDDERLLMNVMNDWHDPGFGDVGDLGSPAAHRNPNVSHNEFFSGRPRPARRRRPFTPERTDWSPF